MGTRLLMIMEKGSSLVLLLFLCTSCSLAQVITIFPDAQDYNAALNSVVSFNCTATDAINPAIQWRVNNTLASANNIVNRGVSTVSQVEISPGVSTSLLRIAASVENSNTSIQCRLFSDNGNKDSTVVVLHVQGLLGPPPNLSLTASSDQLTRTLTWDAPETLDLTDIEPDIEFYQVCYNLSSDDLICVNVSSSERREFIFPNVCVPLIFTVTAFNVVGEGNASEVVHNGSNTCEKSDTVHSSAGHQVSFLQPGNYPTVILTITQNVPGRQETCICIYEVETMTFNVSGSGTTNHGPQIPGVISYSQEDANIIQLSLTVDSDLVADEIYSATIAISSEGNSSATVEFSTYDVQAVDISALPGGLEFSCTFADGSQGRGCILTVCGVENEVIDEGSCVNVTITRSAQALTSSTRHDVSLPGVYSIREVIEVESDGEMTIVRLIEAPGLANVTTLPTTTATETDAEASTDGGGPSSRGGVNVGAIIGGSIVVVLVLIVITVSIFISAAYVHRLKHSKTQTTQVIYDEPSQQVSSFPKSVEPAEMEQCPAYGVLHKRRV